MSEHHHHADIKHIGFTKLVLTIVFNLAISIAEVVGGLLSGSLSLLSDAIHNLGDTISLILSAVAIKYSAKKANNTFTFGYKRAEILAAVFNAGSLLVIIAFIIKEAITKLLHPQYIDANLMLVIAIVGLIGNLLSVFVLRAEHSKSLNLKSAYLHLLADLLSSVVVVAGAIILRYYPIYYIDPILSILIALFILKHTWSVFTESFKILMEYVPENFDVADIKQKILALDAIKDIHDIHIWGLSERNILFEAHVVVDKELSVKETENLRYVIEKLLSDMNIEHITIQFETECDSRHTTDEY